MSNNNEKKQFIEDPRYKQCNREVKYAVILGIVNMVWWFGWGYGLGSQPVEEYSYIMGLPTWFFMSSVVGAVLFTVATFFMVDKFFKHMPLDDMTEEEVKKYLEEVENNA